MIYLDSAATSLLKPDAVKMACVRAMQTCASPGRGSHIYSRRASDTVYECRENISRLFKVEDVEKVVFTFNATHALNIAINSLVEKGTRVLCSPFEHNSVMRPLRARGAEIRIIKSHLFQPQDFLSKAEEMIDWAEVVICTHISNVFGYILPVYELAELCRRHGKAFVVDASQSAGAMEMDLGTLGADFVAFPGHKGLMGPQGTGVLICKNEAKPLLYGGSGSNSLLPLMPEFLPDRLEAGTHNTPGIAGLNEGVKYVMRRGADNIRRHERSLLKEFVRPLLSRTDLRLFFSGDDRLQAGLCSLVHQNKDCEGLSEKLAEAGVAVRAGLHCSPLAHEMEGTLSTGTLRFSFSPFISLAQARTASHVFEKILKKA